MDPSSETHITERICQEEDQEPARCDVHHGVSIPTILAVFDTPPRDGQEKKAEKRSNSVNFIVASHILF